MPKLSPHRHLITVREQCLSLRSPYPNMYKALDQSHLLIAAADPLRALMNF